MKITNIEKGFHGFAPMLNLLEQGMITNVQFLMHSASKVKDEYENYCVRVKADPNDEATAKKYLDPWMNNLK